MVNLLPFTDEDISVVKLAHIAADGVMIWDYNEMNYVNSFDNKQLSLHIWSDKISYVNLWERSGISKLADEATNKEFHKAESKGARIDLTKVQKGFLSVVWLGNVQITYSTDKGFVSMYIGSLCNKNHAELWFNLFLYLTNHTNKRKLAPSAEMALTD